MSENKALIRHAVSVAAVMLCSRLLGFLRQTVIAGTFGSTEITDIYFISNELMINMAGALTTALTSALITVYIDTAKQKGRLAAGQVASKTMTLQLLFAGLIVVLVDVFALPISRLLEPTMDQEGLLELARYLRLFSPAFLFSAVQAIYAAVLNANDSFIPGKLYGLIFNPLSILAVLVLGKYHGIDSLVYAYYLTNFLAIILLHCCSRGIYSFRPTLKLKDPALWQVLYLALPMLLSNVALQLNGVVDKAICAVLGTGIPSDYAYARTLEQFVTGIFTYTLTLVLFPKITWLAAEKDTPKLAHLLQQAAALMVLILAPVALISVIASQDITTLVYQRGDFGRQDAYYTALALAGFAIGFPIVALRELMIRVHFAFQRTRMPMIIGICEVVLNIALSLVLSQFLGILGITLATSLSAILSVILLTAAARRYVPGLRLFALKGTYVKCVLSLALCGLGATLGGLVGGQLVTVVLRIGLGLAGYGAALLLLKGGKELPIVEELVEQFQEKLKRKS